MLVNGSSTRNDSCGAGKKNEVAVILGAQWGDEGKGKIVDLLCQRADVVCRCQVHVYCWREGYSDLLSCVITHGCNRCWPPVSVSILR